MSPLSFYQCLRECKRAESLERGLLQEDTDPLLQGLDGRGCFRPEGEPLQIHHVCE